MAKNELDLQMEDYQYLPLRDVVFRTLRQAILRGELKPGERLMEIRLANQLGVSADELLQDELDFGFIAEANALSKKLEELSRADRKRILETMNFLIVQAGGKSE